MRRLAMVAVLAMACGGDSSSDPACNAAARTFDWHDASHVTVGYYDASGALLGSCDVAANDYAHAACTDGNGGPPLMTGACLSLPVPSR